MLREKIQDFNRQPDKDMDQTVSAKTDRASEQHREPCCLSNNGEEAELNRTLISKE